MRLRELVLEDASGMMEWMQDEEVMQYFSFNPEESSLETAEAFIEQAKLQYSDGSSMHFAIVDDADEYMGTISLKHIDYNVKSAEYAIALRKMAQGQGYGTKATCAILEIAFEQLKMQRIYLNVLSNNEKAIKMYRRIGFVYEGEFRRHLKLKGTLHSIQWFSMLSEEYDRKLGGKSNADI